MDMDLCDGELLLDNNDDSNKTVNVILSLLVVILTALVIFFYLFKLTPVTGSSMETTIHDGQTVFMMRSGYTVNRGDIITLEFPTEDDERYIIKRVIALEGDKVLFVKDENGKNYSLYLCKKGETKFSKLDEPYIKEEMRISHFFGYDTGIGLMDYYSESSISSIDVTETPTDTQQRRLKTAIENNCLTVDDDSVFFLGDNRNYSNDARVFGTKPLSDVTGKLISKLEPNSTTEKFLWFLFGGKR